MREQKDQSNSRFSLAWKIIIAFVIGLLVWAMASIHIIPHATSSANTCINRLRLIDAAANQFALEKGLKPGDEIKYPDDLWPYLGKMHDPMPPYELFKNSEALKCPSGGIYHISKVGEKPTCSLGTTGTPAHVLH